MVALLDPPVAPDVPLRRPPPRNLAVLFSATSFLSAFLLFLVQPMVAKLVLPPFGGAPSVWNTTNAFFQCTLLAGYAYSHLISSRVPRRRQPAIHAVLLLAPLLTLPLALPGWAAPPSDRPAGLWLALVLLVAIGAPFLAVSTTGPLLQRWFSFTDHPRAEDPYFLYAAGNVGSFLALLAYPFVLEPAWSVSDQASIWTGGYALLIGLVAVCGLTVRRRIVPTGTPAGLDTGSASAAEPAPTWRRRTRWVVLAAVPSSLMLGVTSFITADLAAVPLLWVLPLAAYLATFVVAFGRPDRARLALAPTILTAAAVAVAVLVAGSHDVPLVFGIGVHLVLFTAGAYVAHRKLALDRPGPAHLTGFYLLVALGGVLGGAWNAFVAPAVFDRVVEYPLAIVAVAAIGLVAGESRLRRRYGRAGVAVEAGAGFAIAFAVADLTETASGAMGVLAVLAVGIGAASLARTIAPSLGVGAGILALAQILAPLPGDPVLESRTFFGVYRVDQVDGRYEFINGSTSHGAQDPDRHDEPLSYYTRSGPVGQVMDVYGGSADEVGLVGLGVGALAAYGRPGQHLTFYEIDPEVVRIARDSGWFTYLTDTAAEVSYSVGDGRLGLAEPGPDLDLLVLDAFSGDAIPVHLLTVEAFDLYRGRLADGGAIAVHISNRYLDLRPVLAGAADELGLAGIVRRDPGTGDGHNPSMWAVLAEDPETLAPFADDDRWTPLEPDGAHVWTDAHSDLLSVVGVGD